jgi:hypothetical protein
MVGLESGVGTGAMIRTLGPSVPRTIIAPRGGRIQKGTHAFAAGPVKSESDIRDPSNEEEFAQSQAK